MSKAHQGKGEYFGRLLVNAGGIVIQILSNEIQEGDVVNHQTPMTSHQEQYQQAKGRRIYALIADTIQHFLKDDIR